MSEDDVYSGGNERYDTAENCSEIVCVDCGSPPRLLSLDKNAGTTVCCDCDDVKHHQDGVPYEYAVHHMPDSWVVVEDNAGDEVEVDANQGVLPDV